MARKSNIEVIIDSQTKLFEEKFEAQEELFNEKFKNLKQDVKHIINEGVSNHSDNCFVVKEVYGTNGRNGMKSKVKELIRFKDNIINVAKYLLGVGTPVVIAIIILWFEGWL